MKKLMIPIIPFDDFSEPYHERTFQDFNSEQDRETWRGRGAIAELPELPQLGGAGGNADDQGDPIDTYHENHRGSLIVGPESVTGTKGNHQK